MSLDASSEVGRNLIGSNEPGLLTEVARLLTADPTVTVVDTHGPADAPSLIVADMPGFRAEQLREQFAGRLIVEPDAPLEPLR